MRVFLFLQLISLIIFVYIMYFVPSNLYLFSVIATFLIVNTVGITYYVFRMWGKELVNATKQIKLLYFSLLVVAVVGLGFLFANLFNMWIDRYPIDTLSNFLNALLVVSTFLLVSFGVSYVALKRELERQVIEYKKLNEAQMKLRMQVFRYKTNPHFLFNSMSTAVSMIDLGESNDKLREYLINLSELFRAVLEAPEVWTLKDEISLVKKYLDIQKIRLSNFDYMIDIQPECEGVKIPSLILQPIVENSIIHGVTKSTNSGVITIEAKQTDGFILLSIQDNGKGASEIVKGAGLQMVENLLKTFDKDSELIYETSPGKGTKVFLRWLATR
ncbi:sensor histidine kinase [Fervidobacterium gondwanense]|uniref:Histidine kinase n=1 Tax=Fervidobacterium gondwanense DSM 13020 TaxID=1121883 RepID=A0A1M7SV24_FERGO|nr:histidine kinase [Fervidobacterium gondwanense]SHN62393.1 Histidine kinase [Fervidobacterium gondwanense DSM 13020]